MRKKNGEKWEMMPKAIKEKWNKVNENSSATDKPKSHTLHPVVEGDLCGSLREQNLRDSKRERERYIKKERERKIVWSKKEMR